MTFLISKICIKTDCLFSKLIYHIREGEVNLRPACGWVEVKSIVVFRDENREIRDRF